MKEFEDKAQDYLRAGVSRVWVVDPEAITIRVFFPMEKVKFIQIIPRLLMRYFLGWN
jgi:Uma2 family endonuclease